MKSWANRKLAIATLLMLAAACGSPAPAAFDRAEAQKAAREAAQWLDGGQVQFVCGPSAGSALYAREWAKGLQDDQITGGRTVLITRPDGSADIVFRDATGSFISAKQDGADVRTIGGPERSGGAMWVAVYPDAGIIETHNVEQTDAGEFGDLFTINRAAPATSGASAKVLRSACIRMSGAD